MKLTVVPAEDSWIKKQGVTLMLLFAFLFTALLVQQQQQTIESQRVLISQLFGDSVQLANMKIKAVREARQQATR